MCKKHPKHPRIKFDLRGHENPVREGPSVEHRPHSLESVGLQERQHTFRVSDPEY